MWTLEHPMVGNYTKAPRAALVNSPWYPYRARWVGQDPGAGWTTEGGKSPAKIAQEKAQGFTQIEAMNLQAKVSALRVKVDGIVSQMDPSTDAASQAALKSLQSSVTALDTAVANFMQNKVGYVYANLLGTYNALAGQLASFGIEEAVEPAPVPSGGGGGAPPAPAPPKVVQHAATPSAPVVTLKPSGGAWDWIQKNVGYVAAGVLIVAGGVMLKVAKVL